MATNIYSTNSYGTSTIGNSTTIVSSNNIAYDFINRNENIKDFIEFGFQLMGIDLTYDKFIEMDEMERKTFIRDYRLEKLLKNNEE